MSTKYLKQLKTGKQYMNYLRQRVGTNDSKIISLYSSMAFRQGRPVMNKLQTLIMRQQLSGKTRPVKAPKLTFKSPFHKLLFTTKSWFMLRLNYVRKEIRLLLSSRIIQFMLFLPAGYLTYMLGRQIYIEQMRTRFVGFYNYNSQPTLDRIKAYVVTTVGEILNDKAVEKEGTEFVSRLFTDPNTHEAAVILLKNVLNDPRFMEEAKIFGVELIANVVKTPLIQEDFKQLVMKTLESEEVRYETIQLLRYITGKKESEDILADYFKNIFLRDDLLKVVSQALTKSALEVLDNPITKEKFGKFAIKIASDDSVKNSLYSQYLYKPAKRFFSFGLLGAEEQIQPQNTQSAEKEAAKI